MLNNRLMFLLLFVFIKLFGQNILTPVMFPTPLDGQEIVNQDTISGVFLRDDTENNISLNTQNMKKNNWKKDYGIIDGFGAIAGHVKIWEPGTDVMNVELHQYGSDKIIASGKVQKKQHGKFLILNIPPGIYKLHSNNHHKSCNYMLSPDSLNVMADYVTVVIVEFGKKDNRNGYKRPTLITDVSKKTSDQILQDSTAVPVEVVISKLPKHIPNYFPYINPPRVWPILDDTKIYHRPMDRLIIKTYYEGRLYAK
ncbi:hypothetical protein H8E88_27945 [candidate division KSB1 bacterium]|nr:hypothetical protein [candidate division KSB1 bacterium]